MNIMPISDFIKIIKDSNYNLIEIFKQAPNESLIVVAVVLVIVFAIYFYIQRNIKISNALKLIDKIQDVKSFDEYNEKISKLVEELPKRGERVAQLLNETKEHILLRTSKLLADLPISEKIEKYQDISKKYEKLSAGSKKYGNNELNSFYETKAKELLEVNLYEEIVYYIENTHFNEDEIENTNCIVKYANSTQNPSLILEKFFETLDKFSFTYNLDLYKFIKKLTKDDSKQLYKYCNEKLENILTSTKDEVSILILEHMLESNDEQLVYDYISTLTLKEYLQQLYNQLFNKKDNLNLDLAFIANPTKIENEYKKYIDESLTNNWRDSEHIEFVSKAPGVLEVLGHMEFRTLIERIDNLASECENRKMVQEALTIAKRAESIALEAKSLNKRPIAPATKISQE